MLLVIPNDLGMHYPNTRQEITKHPNLQVEMRDDV